MASGPGGGEIFPDQYFLTADWQASPSHALTLRLIAETSQYIGNYTIYISDEPKLRWKRDENTPYGLVVSELEFACFLDPHAGPGSGIDDWPEMFQDETYGRWRVELDVNGVLFWFGYLLPQSIRVDEADPLGIVSLVAVDGLASLKEITAPVTDEFTFERCDLFMRKAFEANPNSAYPWAGAIVETTDNAWRFRQGSTDYYWDDTFLYPFAFIDDKTGQMPSWWDVITELCKRFMLIVTVGAGRISIADVVTQPPTISGLKRTDGAVQNGALVTKTSIRFPITKPSAEIKTNSDPELQDWQNEVDYLRKWVAPWTLDNQGNIIPSRYVPVIVRIGGFTRQNNISGGEAEQKALLEQTELDYPFLPHTIVEVDVKIVCDYITIEYDPENPDNPNVTYSDGEYHIEVKCGSYWYNTVSQSWQSTPYLISSGGYTSNRIYFIIIKLPPVPDKLTLRLRNPLGNPYYGIVSESDPPITYCSSQDVHWAKLKHYNILGFFLKDSTEDPFEPKMKSRTTSVFVPQSATYEFRVTLKPGKLIGLPFLWPDVNSLRMENTVTPTIDSVWRTDNPGFVNQDMDQVWLESYMLRYGGTKPIQYMETEFWPAILTPLVAITLADGSVLRNPVELECNLFKATTRGRWERDVP